MAQRGTGSPTTMLGVLNRAHSADAHGMGNKMECGLPLSKPGPHETHLQVADVTGEEERDCWRRDCRLAPEAR